MRYLLKAIILLITLAGISLPSLACRFTVREIGFSTLSQTNYTFVVIDNGSGGSNATLKTLQAYKKNSNIGVIHFNEESDQHNPIVQLAKRKGLAIPSIFLLSPTNRICLLGSGNQNMKRVFTETVLDSPLRKKLREDTETTFAYVISIDGLDQGKNKKALKLINAACRQLKELMPLMPKEVKRAPLVVRLTKEDFEKEKVLLWSLGIDTISEEPQAIIIYGRGRMMGNALNYQQIEDSLVYRYLSMIGADCECGLDRKWMLGVQIPMVWDADCRQSLAEELGFDVDNPSILAEMSRIISKEQVEENAQGVGYGLESIDLNEAFGVNDSKPKIELVEEDSSIFQLKTILLSLLLLVVVSGIASIIIIRRKK